MPQCPRQFINIIAVGYITIHVKELTSCFSRVQKTEHFEYLAATPFITSLSLSLWETVGASSLVQLLSLQCSLEGMGVQA
jgi:hypothetical protein